MTTLFVLVDIGCIECGESSDVLGIFTDINKAEALKKLAEERHEANWTGQHSFEIFKVDKLS